jgi:hypothetical protein
MYPKDNGSLNSRDRVKEWDLNVNMESTNRNYLDEEYQVEIKANNDSELLGPIFRKLVVPSLSVRHLF